jgi:hypothetical protein
MKFMDLIRSSQVNLFFFFFEGERSTLKFIYVFTRLTTTIPFDSVLLTTVIAVPIFHHVMTIKRFFFSLW